MPRFLWIGLIACALCVLGAVALVRAIEPGSSPDPLVHALPEQSARPETDLVGAASQDSVDRAAVALPSPAPKSRAQGARSDRSRPVDVDYIEAPPTFDDGVVEVRVVRDEDGSPVAGARVERESEWESELDAGEKGVRGQTTDPTGVTVFTQIMQGGDGFTASAPGRAPAFASVVTNRNTPFVSLELRLRIQRDVTVRLLDALGRPFRAKDWHIDRRAADRIGILLTKSCGAIGSSPDVHDAPTHRARSEAGELGPFTWKLEVQAPGEVCVLAVLGDAIVGAEPLDPRATEVSVRVDPAAIESVLAPVVVRVLAAAGDVPIEGALVELEGNVTRDPKLTTGADGRVSVGFANSGLANLVVTARGFAPARIAVARPFPPEFVTRLVPGRRIEGRVVDQDGAPISGARIELPGAGPGVAASMRSAAGGVFRFHDLPSAEFMVHATYSAKPSAGGGQRVIVKADCRDGDVLDLRMEIPVSKSSTPATPR